MIRPIRSTTLVAIVLGWSAASAQTITPGQAGIDDAAGHHWQISPSGSIQEDGAWVAGGGGTSALTITNSAVYGQDSGHGPVNPGGWFLLNGGQQGYWSPAPAPPATTGADTTPSPGPTTTQPLAPATTALGLAASYSCNSAVPNSAASHGGFWTVGGQVLAPDGTPYIARGINLRSNELADIPAVLAAFPNINFIRLNIRDPQPSPASLATAVNQLTARGIVVELEYHPNAGGGQGSITALQGSDVAWLAAAASYFKDNPYVWYGTYNEPPTDGSLSVWHLAEYKAIRDAGATSPILIEPGGSRPWNLLNPLDLSVYAQMENIVADPHVYAYQDGYSDDPAVNAANVAAMIDAARGITSLNGKVPVIIGEFGDSTAGVVRDQGGPESVHAVLDSGVGFAAWSWISAGADELQSGGRLTDYGEWVASAIRNGTNAQLAGCNISPIATLVPTTQTIRGMVPQNSLAAIPSPPGL